MRSSDPTRRALLAAGAAGALVGCDEVVIDERTVHPLVEGDSIPPITPNEDFYVYQCCGTPDVDEATWRLELADRGQVLATLDIDAVTALEPTEVEHTLECIGATPRNPNIGNALWRGAPLSEVLLAAGVDVGPEIVELLLVGYDDYQATIPASDLDLPVWVVWEMNGEPLPRSHGGPVRLLVPGRFGVKNLKWIRRIELLDAPGENFWDPGGWDREAEISANGFILAPVANAQLEAGAVRVLGTAFAGIDPVAKVEISLDRGKSWQEATLDYSPGPGIWTTWSADVALEEPGDHEIRCRVTTESGAVSGPPEDGNPFDGYDGGMAIDVKVL